jgi:hypothetical protein
MGIDIDRLSEAELVDLNRRIVERLRLLAQMRAHAQMLEFKVGDRVTFQGIVKLLGHGREGPRDADRAHWRLRHAGDTSHFGPGPEGAGPGGAILGGRQAVATEVEEVADLVVGGEEALRVPG